METFLPKLQDWDSILVGEAMIEAHGAEGQVCWGAGGWDTSANSYFMGLGKEVV